MSVYDLSPEKFNRSFKDNENLNNNISIPQFKEPKIKAILIIFNSKRNTYGNVYWAFKYVDTLTGDEVEGTISGGESNITASVKHLGLDWGSCCLIRKELSIREFKRETKSWKHAGCLPDDIAKYIIGNIPILMTVI